MDGEYDVIEEATGVNGDVGTGITEPAVVVSVTLLEDISRMSLLRHVNNLV